MFPIKCLDVLKCPKTEIFKKLQILSSSFYSLGHGTNDAQKTMGVITLLLFTSGYLTAFNVPTWVILISHASIALGTYFGGWRIIKTMGIKITKLTPFHGFSAETSGALVLLGTAHFGIPVSTTHVISGSIMGVGSVRRYSGVRWQIARRIVFAWVLTIPMSAIIAALSYLVIGLFL
jgi:PiT family inorganic phosphate transporter